MNRPILRECYRVADLQIDVGAMRVRQGDREIHLPPLSFELLLLLVRRAPDVVGREECLAKIWSGVVVGPETLKQRVKLLREALGDDSRRPRYVETVRGRGYRLLPEVELAGDGATDWPSRLRSRLKILLGNSGGNHGGRGNLAFGGVLLMMILSIYGLDGPDDRTRAELGRPDTDLAADLVGPEACPGHEPGHVLRYERRSAACD